MANCGTPVGVSTIYATRTDLYTSSSFSLVTLSPSGSASSAGDVSTSTILITGSSTRVIPQSTVYSTPPCTTSVQQTSAASSPSSAPAASTRAAAASSTSTLVATSLSTSNGNVVTQIVTQVVVGAGPSATVVASSDGNVGQTVGTSRGSSSSHVGPIVGGVIGGVVALALVALLARWFLLRRRRARDSEKLDAFFGGVNVSRGHSLDGSAGGAGGGLDESKLSGDGAQARPPQPWGSPAGPAMSEAGYGAAGWGAHGSTDAAQRASGYYGASTQMHSTASGPNSMYPEQAGYGNVTRNPSGSSAHANHAQQAYGVAAGALAAVGAAGAAGASAHNSAPNTVGRSGGKRNSVGRPVSSGAPGGGRTYSQSSGGDRSHPGSPQFAPHRAISPPPRQPSTSPPPQQVQAGQFPPSRYGHLDVGVAPGPSGGSPASQSPGISREASLSAVHTAGSAPAATPPAARSPSGNASSASVQAYQASMARQASEALVASKSPRRSPKSAEDDDIDVAAEREAAAKLWGAHRGLHVANGADVQTP